MRKDIAVIACVFAFLLGVLARLCAEPPKRAEAKQPQGKLYEVNFNNGRKCDFCGSQPAEWYQFRTRKKDGAVTAEYLCVECYNFVNYARAEK